MVLLRLIFAFLIPLSCLMTDQVADVDLTTDIIIDTKQIGFEV